MSSKVDPPLPDQNKWLEQGDGSAETARWSRVPLSRMKSITTRRQGWERAMGYPSAGGCSKAGPTQSCGRGFTPCRNIMRSPEGAEQAENSYSTDT